MATTTNPGAAMSAKDQARIEAYREIYNSATDQVTKDAAHKAAEDIRQAYGYSGGADGSQYITEGLEQSAGNHFDASLSAADQAAVDQHRLQYYIAQATGNQAGMDAAHNAAEAIRAQSGYSGGADGSDYIALQQQQAAATIPGVSAREPAWSATDLRNQMLANVPNTDPWALTAQQKANLPNVNQTKADMQALLDAQKTAMETQSNNQIDYAVNQGVTELERALADAQPQFKEQQESIARDEMQSRDNAALYAEARGDKGGIGQEQYNSIMNTAAQNRLAVQQAQTKLSTDTQRQIADLRAQGEFDKADAMLEISQQYLSQLISLEQWAFDAGMTVEQFKASLDQWAANYEMAIAEFTTGIQQWAANYDMDVNKYLTSIDQWNKEFAFNQQQANISNNQWQQEFDYQKQQGQQSNLVSTGEALLSAGILPSSSQLAAMGMTNEQAQAYIAAAKLAQQNELDLAWYKATKDSGGSDDDDDKTSMTLTTAKAMAEAGQFTDEVITTLKNAGFNDAYLEETYGYTPNEGAPEAAKDGVMTENTVAWAWSVLNARDGDVDYLVWALEQRGFPESEIKKVLTEMGLMK